LVFAFILRHLGFEVQLSGIMTAVFFFAPFCDRTVFQLQGKPASDFQAIEVCFGVDLVPFPVSGVHFCILVFWSHFW